VLQPIKIGFQFASPGASASPRKVVTPLLAMSKRAPTSEELPSSSPHVQNVGTAPMGLSEPSEPALPQSLVMLARLLGRQAAAAAFAAEHPVTKH